jgi:hypothetical protein
MLRSAVALLLTTTSPALAEERRAMVTQFDSIRVEGPFRVIVTTGATVRPAAVASGSPRALDGVDIRVEDRTLVIRASTGGWGGWPGDRIEQASIEISSPHIAALSLTGGGQITLDRMQAADASVQLAGSGRIRVAAIDADRLDTRLIGSGALELSGSARRASFTNTGTGAITAGGLAVRDLTARSESSGDSRFAASQSATVSALGLGAIDVTGGAPCTASGPGPMRCGKGD